MSRAYIYMECPFRRIPMMSGLTLLDAEWQVQRSNGWIYAALAMSCTAEARQILIGRSSTGEWPTTPS